MTKNDKTTTASSKDNKKTLNDELILDSQINDSDILCGKEKHCVSHPGSLNFRAVIDKYASKYQEAITKQEKMNVTKEIYDTLGSQNSRFLKFNAKSQGWEELSSLLARDKISHALRFANREKKQAGTPTTTNNNKTRAKKGHRRNGSDASTDTLTTAATELSVEDFEVLMDDEPLDFSNLPDEDEPRPYVYPVYESAPPSPPTAAVYHHHSYYYPHPHHHAYGHGGYYHPRSYHHHHHPYHHQQQHHHQHYRPAPAPQPPMTHPYHTMEQQQPMNFPEEKAYPQAPVRESGGMDIDLSYLVAEPLMDFELEPEQVRMVNYH